MYQAHPFFWKDIAFLLAIKRSSSMITHNVPSVSEVKLCWIWAEVQSTEARYALLYAVPTTIILLPSQLLKHTAVER